MEQTTREPPPEKVPFRPKSRGDGSAWRFWVNFFLSLLSIATTCYFGRGCH
jgi:hypothetical protein